MKKLSDYLNNKNMSTITKSDFIYSFREFILGMRKQWKSIAKKQAEITREEIIGFRDGVLIPVLEKITIFAGNAIRLDKYTEFEDSLKMLAEIYQLSGEVQRFNVIGQEEHLSWTLPSKLAMEYLFTISALVLKHKNWADLELLLNCQIEYPNTYPYEGVAGTCTYLFNHPFYNYSSNEGSLMTFFDEAKKITIENKIFFDWFDEEEESVQDYLVKFDFLRSFFLVEKGLAYHYSNFRRYYTYRVLSIIRSLLTNPSFKKIYGNNIKDELYKFLEMVDSKNQEFSDDWSSFGEWKKEFE